MSPIGVQLTFHQGLETLAEGVSLHSDTVACYVVQKSTLGRDVRRKFRETGKFD